MRHERDSRGVPWIAVVIIAAMLSFGIPIAPQAHAEECDKERITTFFEAAAERDFHRAFAQFSSKQRYFRTEADYVAWAESQAARLDRQGGERIHQEVDVEFYEFEPCQFAVSVVISSWLPKAKILNFFGFDAVLDGEGIVVLVLTDRLPAIVKPWKKT
jgi:hypothetical protein